jgi:hypothetical protein
MVEGDALTWKNIGPWKSGLTDSTDSGAVPAVVTGFCYAVMDMGQHNNWSDNEVAEDAGLNGPSYLRGSYDIWTPGSLTGNSCDGDLPDAYGNRQCWWGGDQFANGGPAYLAPNGQSVAASGGGTAWVGDYSVLVLADNISHHYNDLQGMSKGQQFSITSKTVPEVIDPWSWEGQGGSVNGHPSLQTCTGGPLIVTPGSYYNFYYNPSSQYAVTQTNCPIGSDTSTPFASISPATLSFGSQIDGTASPAQTVTLTNVSTTPFSLVVATSDDFSQTNNCSATLAAGAVCTISVSFSPTVGGAHAGILSITNNSRGSQAITLTGSGTESASAAQPSVALTSSVAQLQMSVSGPPATLTLTAVSQNGFNGLVNLKCQIISQDQPGDVETPACSFSPGQITISKNAPSSSALMISSPPSQSSLASQRNLHHRSISLVEVTLVGLLPFGLLRRKAYAVLFGTICLIGVVGCGYSPNHQSASYKLVITAASGTQTLGSISIPLSVQVQ